MLPSGTAGCISCATSSPRSRRHPPKWPPAIRTIVAQPDTQMVHDQLDVIAGNVRKATSLCCAMPHGPVELTGVHPATGSRPGPCWHGAAEPWPSNAGRPLARTLIRAAARLTISLGSGAAACERSSPPTSGRVAAPSPTRATGGTATRSTEGTPVEPSWQERRSGQGSWRFIPFLTRAFGAVVCLSVPSDSPP